MARPKKITEEQIAEPDVRVEVPQGGNPVPPSEQFDPSLPESKQRHLR